MKFYTTVKQSTKQPRLKSSGLQRVVTNAGDGLQKLDQDVDKLRPRILLAWDELDHRVI